MTMDIGVFVEVDGQVFYIHENGGPGSGRRPTGATAVEITPKKSNRIKMYRQGKKIAKEIQMRKTYYEMDIGLMVDVDGEMYYTRNNGGDGSGNFGHAGIPGQVGGSSSGGGGGTSGYNPKTQSIKSNIKKYAVIKTMIDSFTTNAPLKVKSEAHKILKDIEDHLKKSGYKKDYNGKWVEDKE